MTTQAMVQTIRAPSPGSPSLEWVASGVGLLLTFGVFGLIGWQALDDAAPRP